MDVIARSQRGRICRFADGGVSVTTPCVMTDEGPLRISFEDGKRMFHVFENKIGIDSDILISESSGITSEPVSDNGICVVRVPFGDFEVPEKTKIVVIANAFELRKDSRKLIFAVMTLREKAGYNVLIAAPGLADVGNLALLCYMGVDIFDASVAATLGNNNILSIPEGSIECDENQAERNIFEMKNECEKIREFILGGRLRELVDQRISSPQNVAILRIFDKEGFGYQEEACPTVGAKFSCNTVQSLRRPEILRYRNKMKEYRKPSNKKILLLLPCSAKKPYHISKSHKRFASAIHTASHDAVVHEVIVTSPLGIVPRELDIFFPANSYDIPVTGEWKPEEREFIRGMLSDLLKQGYEKVVSHLGETTDLIRDLCEMEETVVGDNVSPASLEKLDETLRTAAKGMKCDYGTDRKETMRSVLGFQFGNDAADAILDENTEVTGKFPYWKIMRNRKQLGMMTAERGMVSLTMDGGKILASLGRNTVEMTEFELSGSLFAVGVVDADRDIRIGDEAVVTLKGEAIAVGVAEMSGREMVDLDRGVAVKIRHRAK